MGHIQKAIHMAIWTRLAVFCDLVCMLAFQVRMTYFITYIFLSTTAHLEQS